MNVKINSGNIKQLQKSLLEMQKLKNAEFKKELLEQKKDLKEISQDSFNLKNLDAENSAINYNNQLIDFNLVFNFFTTIQVIADGRIEREKQSLEVNFRYAFQREMEEEGKTVIKNFVVELKMKASFEETISEQKRIEKEDILNFIQRVVNEIFDTFNDKSMTLRAVIINKDDFEEIVKAGNGELIKLLQTLLGAVFSYMKLKEVSKKNNPAISVVLHPQREIHEVKEYSVNRIESFTVEINQLEEQKDSKKRAELQ